MGKIEITVERNCDYCQSHDICAIVEVMEECVKRIIKIREKNSTSLVYICYPYLDNLKKVTCSHYVFDPESPKIFADCTNEYHWLTKAYISKIVDSDNWEIKGGNYNDMPIYTGDSFLPVKNINLTVKAIKENVVLIPK